MSYRSINVNGTDYEYVIGKSNIHIKGFGDFPSQFMEMQSRIQGMMVSRMFRSATLRLLQQFAR